MRGIDASYELCAWVQVAIEAAQAGNAAGACRRTGGHKVMRKLLGVATIAAALTLGAGVALADDVTGKIENIDLSSYTFQVKGQVFQWSPENSQGVKLKDLKDGDMVKVMYEPNQSKAPDVMSITKEK
jgi:hypothetical protein